MKSCPIAAMTPIGRFKEVQKPVRRISWIGEHWALTHGGTLIKATLVMTFTVELRRSSR